MPIDLAAYLLILGAVLALIYQWVGPVLPIVMGVLVAIVLFAPMKYLDARFDDDEDKSK